MYAIGDVAKLTGLKIPTIRFYEQEGLLPRPARTPSGRRRYTDMHLKRLAFIRHGRALGFDLTDIRSLLQLSDHPEAPCADAVRIAHDHLVSTRKRIAQLLALERELKRVSSACSGVTAGSCGIIEALSINAVSDGADRSTDATTSLKRTMRRK